MIPPGIITLKLVSIRFNKSFKAAVLFALGVGFVEFFQTIATLRFSGVFINFFDGNIYIKWAAVIILLIISIGFFIAKPKESNLLDGNEVKEINKKTSFIKGVMLSVFNFLKYPFWITQAIYFMKNGLIDKQISSLVVYSLGASLGSLAMYYTYIKAGIIILAKFEKLANNLNKVLAVFFLFLASIQIINIYYS